MVIRRRIGLIGFLTAWAVWLAAPPPAFAVPGDLDTTFGGDGIVATNFSSGSDFIWDIAIQADGKIVGAGASVGGLHFALARYHTDGTLDTTFGGDGRVVTLMTAGQDIIQAIAIQPDQKIVVAGRVGGLGGRYGLARYNTDGTLDATFGNGGKVKTNLTDRWDHAWGLAIQPDGKIVAAGASGVGGGAFSIVRYDPDGTLDQTFSGDGRSITHFTSGDDWAWDVALQPDGKIVAAGAAGRSSNKRVALVRYTATGALDSGFGGDGKVTRNATTGWDDATGVGIQPDGKIVTVGAAGGSGGQLLVNRFNGDGSSDTSFSGNGYLRMNFTTNYDQAWDVALQPDGRIVAAGVAGLGGNDMFAVARFESAGSIDTTFSGDGKVTTDVTSGFDLASAVAIQPDGAIVVGGVVGGSGGRFGVVRYLG